MAAEATPAISDCLNGFRDAVSGLKAAASSPGLPEGYVTKLTSLQALLQRLQEASDTAEYLHPAFASALEHGVTAFQELKEAPAAVDTPAAEVVDAMLAVQHSLALLVGSYCQTVESELLRAQAFAHQADQTAIALHSAGREKTQMQEENARIKSQVAQLEAELEMHREALQYSTDLLKSIHDAAQAAGITLDSPLLHEDEEEEELPPLDDEDEYWKQLYGDDTAEIQRQVTLARIKTLNRTRRRSDGGLVEQTSTGVDTPAADGTVDVVVPGTDAEAKASKVSKWSKAQRVRPLAALLAQISEKAATTLEVPEVLASPTSAAPSPKSGVALLDAYCAASFRKPALPTQASTDSTEAGPRTSSRFAATSKPSPLGKSDPAPPVTTEPAVQFAKAPSFADSVPAVAPAATAALPAIEETSGAEAAVPTKPAVLVTSSVDLDQGQEDPPSPTPVGQSPGQNTSRELPAPAPAPATAPPPPLKRASTMKLLRQNTLAYLKEATPHQHAARAVQELVHGANQVVSGCVSMACGVLGLTGAVLVLPIWLVRRNNNSEL